MLFDCGHHAEIGRPYRGKFLCARCVQRQGYPQNRRFPEHTAMPSSQDQDTDISAILALIKKRLPSEWPDNKLEKIARRMARVVRERFGGVKTPGLNGRGSLKPSLEGMDSKC